MRYAIISDIHSNLQALESALESIKKMNVDEIICLGDIVGYNANPSECVDLIRDTPEITHCLMGNHDDYTSITPGFSTIKRLSNDAWDGIQYSSNNLSKKQKKWLARRPTHEVIDDGNLKFMIVHSSPHYNAEFSEYKYPYILATWEANQAIHMMHSTFKVNLCLYGHTHMPTFIKFGRDGSYNDFEMDYDQVSSNGFNVNRMNMENNPTFDLKDAKEDNADMLFNGGAIGQPRHGNPVGFGVLDTNDLTYSFHNFTYDINAAVKAINDAKYSQTISQRLITNLSNKFWL